MQTYGAFLVPGGLAMFAASIGIAAWIAQHRRHMAAERRDSGRDSPKVNAYG